MSIANRLAFFKLAKNSTVSGNLIDLGGFASSIIWMSDFLLLIKRKSSKVRKCVQVLFRNLIEHRKWLININKVFAFFFLFFLLNNQIRVARIIIFSCCLGRGATRDCSRLDHWTFYVTHESIEPDLKTLLIAIQRL